MRVPPIVALVVLGLAVAALPVAAHPVLQNTLWVVITPEAVRVRVKASLLEVCVSRNLPPGADGAYTAALLEPVLHEHAAYLLQHLRLSADGRRLAGRVERSALPRELPASVPAPSIEGYQGTFDFVYALDPRVPPAALAIEQDVLADFFWAPGQAWDVSYVVQVKHLGQSAIEGGLLRRGAPFVYVTQWSRSGEAVGRGPGVGATVRAYVRHGVAHILGGWDHLLFVGALVLAAASLVDLLVVVAAFTLAHTLTLALSVLGLVRLAPGWVEPAIATSIILVALENVLPPPTPRRAARGAVAFGFGLVHGLGFAGGLLDAMQALPRLDVGVAIASFSLGVEVGHLAFVAPLFALLLLGQQAPAPARAPVALRYGSGLIAACGLFYLVNALTAPGGLLS